MIDPLDTTLRERLGPLPTTLLTLLSECLRAGEFEGLAVVTQDREGRLALYSAGCTVMETVGMLAWGLHLATDGLEAADEPDGQEEES